MKDRGGAELEWVEGTFALRVAETELSPPSSPGLLSAGTQASGSKVRESQSPCPSFHLLWVLSWDLRLTRREPQLAPADQGDLPITALSPNAYFI